MAPKRGMLKDPTAVSGSLPRERLVQRAGGLRWPEAGPGRLRRLRAWCETCKGQPRGMRGFATSAGVKTSTSQPEDFGSFQVLLESLVDYELVLLTPEGQLASWHAGAERLKGYTAEDIVGQPFDRFYTAEDRAA